MGEYTEQNPLRLIELFAGIGSQTQALTNIGVPHTVVGISEIDKYAIQSYKAMHGEVTNFGDIREIKSLPDADLWTLIMSIIVPCVRKYLANDIFLLFYHLLLYLL